jgi:hypothetical protein
MRAGALPPVHQIDGSPAMTGSVIPAPYRDLETESLNSKPANPKRGLKDHIIAVPFIREYPIGTTISAAQFDDWGERHGLFTVPRNVSKASIAWKAHLMDRHHLKMRLNRGGTHPRLMDEGLTPFSLDSIGQGVFEIRSPQIAIIQDELPHKLQSLLNTKHRRLTYLLQSVDRTQIPAWDQVRMETIVDAIEGLRDRVNAEVMRIDRQYQKLDQRIHRWMEAGETTKPALTSS